VKQSKWKYSRQKVVMEIEQAGFRLLVPVILSQEAEIRRLSDQGQMGQIVHETTFQKTSTRRTGGVAQVAEGLLCKFKALSSNSSPKNNNKKSMASSIRKLYTNTCVNWPIF
jgi:RNA polymerase-interacting CarD/CdnL/TRCF family regulator